MSKQEFLDTLRRSISGMNDYTFVNETMEYYEEYIERQIRMGKSEAEVMEELGDPRLIAKSIVASKDSVEEQSVDGSTYGFSDADTMNNTKVFQTKSGKVVKLPVWLTKVLTVVAIVAVVVVVCDIAKFLLPIAIVAMAAVFVYRFIRDNLM